jgi:NAD(P)-dependent dehydrogenase (short-subunit alcohol dehydrogenase family)
MKQDRIAVVSGATTGIGFAAACGLADLGFRLIVMGRDRDRMAAAKSRLAESGALADWIEADFASMQETRRAASEIAGLTDRIDVLVNNAGALFDGRYVTVDGLERSFALNHLAPFLLTQMLMPQLTACKRPHVIAVSSIGHTFIPDMRWHDLQMEKDFAANQAYFQSKLANVLFTRELGRRAADEGLIASAVQPGLVGSNFPDSADPETRKFYAEAVANGTALTNEQGADTIVWLAANPDAALPSGGYFEKRRSIDPSPAAQNDAGAARLWEISERLTGLS